MAIQGNDPGTGTRFNTSGRLINKDGTFNVKRKGGVSALSDVYHFMVNASWIKFNLVIISLFLIINVIFSVAYMCCSEECITGRELGDGTLYFFLRCFYFSVQTMTTIGYGHLYPACHSTQIVASVEALTGLMCLAVMTGVFYGRFSKPVSKLKFSKQALIAPFKEGNAFMFRFANKRNDVLVNVQATVLFSKSKLNEGGEEVREYFRMPLQFESIQSMPLSWTVVHPIDDQSPLWQKSLETLKQEHAEVLIQIRAFDEIYHAEVFARYSYSAEEIMENARFTKTFDTASDGTVVLDLNTIGNYEHLN